MNRTSQSRDCFFHRACRNFVAAVLFVLVSLTLVAGAWAQNATSTTNNNAAGGNNDLATNDGGNVDDTNSGSAGKIRENYFKRYPFARDAFKHDTLQTVSAAAAQNTGGNANKDTNARDSVTGAQGNTAGTNTTTTTGSEGETTNLKQSELNTSPTKVLAYDMMVLPLYGIGHWLPGAEAWKQPQYTSQYDYPPIYIQPTKMYGMDKPLTKRDNELFDNTLTTWGLPISDTQYQLINRENNQRFLELLFDPERVLWLATNTSQMQGASAANSIGASAEAAYGTAANYIINGPASGAGTGGGGGAGGGGAQVGALINIANENSGVPTASDNPNKTIPQAVWMVQQMYRQVFVPLAILFLLPGAVISQVKMQIVQGMGSSGAIKSDDPPNPFEGILRSVVAVFLIPATQLIVSYAIDTGNSMAYSCKDWVNINLIVDWAHQLSYNPPPGNVDNAIINPSGAPGSTTSGGGGTNGSGNGFFSGLGSDLSFIPGAQTIGNAIQGVFNMLSNPGAGGDGLGANVGEDNTIVERQLWLSQIMQVAFNMAMYLFSTAVITLGAYQLIMMCYLYLLGPLAAAFFAWPSIAGSAPGLFRNIFSNWLNAVICCALWRFYWMVILAIMTQRILYLQDNGGNLDLQWEVAVFTCLLGLMMYVPFNPWSFDPGTAFQQASQSGSALMSGSATGANGQSGGIMGAVGNAAIAGGANPNAVHQLQGAVANETNQMGSLGMNAQERQMQTLGLDGGLSVGAPNQGGSNSGAANMSSQAPPPLSPTSNGGSGGQNNQTQGGGTNAPPLQASNGGGDNGNMSVANNAFANTAVSVQPQGQSGVLPVDQPGGMSAYVAPGASGSQVANSLSDQGYNGGNNSNNDGGSSGGNNGQTAVAYNSSSESSSSNNTSTTNTNNDSGSNNNDSGGGDTRLADSPPPPAFPSQGDDGSFAV